MKIAINIVALLAIIAAAALSYLNIGKIADLQDTQADISQSVSGLKKSVSAEEEALEEKNKELDVVKTEKAETVASIESEKSNATTKQRELSGINADIEGQVNELASLQQILRKIQEKLPEASFEELPGIIAQLKEDVIENEKKSAGLAAAINGAEDRLSSTNGDITRLRKALAERAERISSNTVESTVLAANNTWGFVYVSKAGSFNPGEKLIAKRGGQFIGKLTVQAVEAGGIIADVDQKSVAAGARIRPGDKVIREVALSQ